MNIIIKVVLFIIVVGLMVLATGGHPLQFVDLATVVGIWLMAGSLLLLHYKKGMKKPALMKKLKQYLILAGYLMFLIGAILALKAGVEDREGCVRNIAVSLLSVFWAYIFAYIVYAMYIEE